VLRNQLSGPGCHPERLYETILSLAGHLSAYSPDTSINPAEFPLYDHGNLSTCVNRMADIIASILGGAKPSKHYRKLTLATVRQGLYQTEITAEELAQADFIVSAKSQQVDEARLISELPAMIRIAAPEMIENVLRSYTRAVSIAHTSRLPVGMPEDPMSSYFKIEQSGPFWDGIAQSKSFSLYIPADFGEIQLEVVAIMRG
jgi:type VI secretion system protein ImpJ